MVKVERGWGRVARGGRMGREMQNKEEEEDE
jgi:hypothetical protein